MKFQIIIIFLILLNSISSNVVKPKHHGIRPTYQLEKRRIATYSSRKTFNEYPTLTERPHNVVHGYMNNQDGWKNVNKEDKEAKEIVKFIYQFLGVMGPFLFPLPYVLAMIPFAIPAIPLSFWLESRAEGEAHHRPKPNEKPSDETTPEKPQGSKPHETTTKPPQFTDSSPIIFTTTNIPENNNNTVTNNSGGEVMESSSFSFNGSIFPNFPINMSINPPPDFPPTIFPFPIFLNSSYLGPDYYNEDD